MKYLMGIVMALWCVVVQAMTSPCLPFGLRGESKFHMDYLREVPTGPNGEPGGWYIYQHCKMPDGTWVSPALYCTNGVNCSPNQWGDLQIPIWQSPDRVAKIDQFLAPIPLIPCAGQVTNHGPHEYVCTKLLAAIATTRPAPEVMPPPPPPIQYQVTRAASTANPPHTRPVYRWDGVKLGAAITGLRAVEFEPCDCAIKTVTTVMYCTIPSIKDANGAMRTDALAQCEVKK